MKNIKVGKILIVLLSFLCLGGFSSSFCMTKDIDLLIVCKKNKYNKARCLLEKGANANYCDENDYTPLIWACFNDNHKLVKLLLDNGAKVSINKNNKSGVTPLMLAYYRSNNKLVKLLLALGAKKSVKVDFQKDNLFKKCGISPSFIDKLNSLKLDFNLLNSFDKRIFVSCPNNFNNLIIHTRFAKKEVKKKPLEKFIELSNKKSFWEDDLIKVKKFLKESFAHEMCALEDDYFVHIACEKVNIDLLKVLLAYGAKVPENKFLIRLYQESVKKILKKVKVYDEKESKENKVTYIMQQIKDKELFNLLVKRCFALSEKAFLVDKKEFGETVFIKLCNMLYEKQMLENVTENIKGGSLYQECLKSYFLLHNNFQKILKRKVYADCIVKTQE